MNIEVKAENSYARKVHVRVPADRVRDEIERAFQSLGKRAKLHGFRPGKVPRHVLEARFGPGVREDVANRLVQSAWSRAIEKHALNPVSRPTLVDQGELVSGREFAFVIALDVRPEVKAATYTGLRVVWPAWEITEEQIDAAVEQRRRGQSRLTQVEGRPVQAGDVVQVELTVRDGETVLADEPGTLVRTSGDPWYTGLESFLLGMSIGDEKTGSVSFDAKARTADVAGKTLDVRAKVLAIQANTVPELTDALAEEIGYADIAAMREALKAQLSKGREELARNQARANLLQALIEANPFEVPGGMVEQNLQLLMEELKLQQAYAGRDPRSITFNEAQMADLRIRAAFAAKGALLLESVSTQETLTVTDEDIEAKIAELASQRGQSTEAVRAWFARDEAMNDLKERILEEKTLDWLLDQAQILKEEPVVYAEAAAPAAEAPAAEAAPATEEAAVEEAPKKKKSTKKAAATEEAVEAAAPAAEEAPAEEAPKKKKSTKKAAAADEGAEPAAEEPAAEAAPKKKKSSKKSDEG